MRTLLIIVGVIFVLAAAGSMSKNNTSKQVVPPTTTPQQSNQQNWQDLERNPDGLCEALKALHSSLKRCPTASEIHDMARGN